VVSGDFNGDGHIDLVASPVYYGVIGAAPLLYLQNNGDGTFSAKQVRFDPATLVSVAVVAAADVNGDGKLDLVARDLSTNHGVWLAGHGDGTFDPPVGLGPDKVIAVAGFRGDKSPDLLVERSFFDYAVRAGDGRGSFAPPLGESLNSSVLPHISLGDLNGDGMLDVVARSVLSVVPAYSGQTYIGLGQKDGTFAQTTINSGAFGGIIADVDSDGKLDIVQSSLGLVVLPGNGDGTFKDPVLSPSGATDAYATADFDGDGKLDVISGWALRTLTGDLGLQPPAFAVSLGKGDLTFQRPITFGRVSLRSVPALDPSNPVVIGDFNGDGKPDVAFPSADSTLSVMLNDSPGRAPTSVVSAGDWLPRLAPGSIGVIFGTALASQTVTNTDDIPPTTLGGVKVHVHDSLGGTNDAQLLYVSPGQINFVVPILTTIPGGVTIYPTEPGYAAVTVDNGSGAPEEARSVLVQPVAAAFFTADGTGTGVPLGYVVRTHADQTQTWTPVFTCSGGHCEPAPIDLSGAEPATLVLVGTGLRGTEFRSSTGYNASCYFSNGLNGFGARPGYVGPQGQYPGLDQVNIPLPSGRTGLGDTSLLCTFQYPWFEQLGGGVASASSDTLPLKFK
jgi:uncharacterized protein (TIGR03437 family)